MQNLFAYARPAKKLVADPPRNLSQTRQETCRRPAKKLVADPPRNLSQIRQETCYITNNTTNKLNYGYNTSHTPSI